MSTGRKIFGAFTIAIALLFFWPSVIGSWQEVSALRAAVAEREQLLSQRQKILASAATAYSDYQAKLGQQDGQKFAALVPVRKDTAELVSAIQDIATQSGITVSEIRLSEAQTKSGEQFKTLSMSMDMTGTYPTLRAFMTGLEQYVRLLNVQSIQATPDSQNAGRLRFTVSANTYFLQ